MQELRLAYASQFFIGVCGPQNAGKSTFINSFGFRATVGMVQHTTEAKVYQLPKRKNVMLIDFPGSTSILNHKDIFVTSGHIPNIYVFISPYNGTPDTTLIQNIIHACTMKQLAGKYCEVVFCLNKAYSALRECVEEDKYLLNFSEQKRKDIELIRKHIKKSVESEARNEVTVEKPASKYLLQFNEEHCTTDYLDILQCLDDIKLFYTDWKNYKQEDAIEAGIVGPSHIKDQ